MHTHREGTPGGSCRTSSGRDCGSGTRSERPTKREPVMTTDVATLVRGYPGALNDVPYVLRNGCTSSGIPAMMSASSDWLLWLYSLLHNGCVLDGRVQSQSSSKRLRPRLNT